MSCGGIGWNPHTNAPLIPWSVPSKRRAPKRWTILAVTFDPDTADPVCLVPAGGETLLGQEIADRLRRLVLDADKDAPGVCLVTDDPAALWRYLETAGPAAGDGYRAWGSVRMGAVLALGPDAERHQAGDVEEITATFAGFTWGRRRSVLVLDPTAFCDARTADVIGATPADTIEATLIRLALWAHDLIAWCRECGFWLRPSRGGIAAQALTDARWFHRPRRKVPAWINDLARPHLPGNFYRVLSRRRHPSALELDQRGAHHQAAARLAFTDPDTMAGYGHTDDPQGAGVFCRPDDPAWCELIDRPGLFFLRVRVTRDAAEHPYQLPELSGDAGERTVAVWSVELESVMSDPGVDVLWMVAALVSERRPADAGPGLNGYGTWAWDQLGVAPPKRAVWMKGLLLSVYGVLAQPARPLGRFSSEPTPASVETVVVLGGQLARVQLAMSKRKAEPRYANVVDRGLIEAETRAESRRLAHAIEAMDTAAAGELVAIYADAVLVAYDGARGGVWASDGEEHARWARAHSRAEWRARPRTDLQMLGTHSYESQEVTKMPGVPRERRE